MDLWHSEFALQGVPELSSGSVLHTLKVCTREVHSASVIRPMVLASQNGPY